MYVLIILRRYLRAGIPVSELRLAHDVTWKARRVLVRETKVAK